MFSSRFAVLVLTVLSVGHIKADDDAPTDAPADAAGDAAPDAAPDALDCAKLDYWSIRDCCHIPPLDFSSFQDECPDLIVDSNLVNADAHTCLYENEHLIASDGNLALKNVSDMLPKVLGNDDDFIIAYMMGFMICNFPVTYRSDTVRTVSLNILKLPTEGTSMTAIGFSSCADIEVFKYCPDFAWSHSQECENHREYLFKCFDEEISKHEPAPILSL